MQDGKLEPTGATRSKLLTDSGVLGSESGIRSYLAVLAGWLPGVVLLIWAQGEEPWNKGVQRRCKQVWCLGIGWWCPLLMSEKSCKLLQLMLDKVQFNFRCLPALVNSMLSLTDVTLFWFGSTVLKNKILPMY